MPRNDLKAYGSVTVRLPHALLEEVKAYASQHRRSLSELVRDGLELRLEGGDAVLRIIGDRAPRQ